MLKSTTYYFMNFLPIMMNFSLIMMFTLPSKNNKLNPMNLMMLLILITLIITLKMNFMLNSWMPFILFLIMIGGLMIIFLYITSLFNNELFLFNYKIIFMNFLKFIFMSILLMSMYLYFYHFYTWNNSNYYFFNNYFYYIKINFTELYTIYYNLNSLFIMSYLFFSMICIMNICYKFKSPLRQLYY